VYRRYRVYLRGVSSRHRSLVVCNYVESLSYRSERGLLRRGLLGRGMPRPVLAGRVGGKFTIKFRFSSPVAQGQGSQLVRASDGVTTSGMRLRVARKVMVPALKAEAERDVDGFVAWMLRPRRTRYHAYRRYMRHVLRLRRRAAPGGPESGPRPLSPEVPP
jgi:hypothetical protein